MYYIATTAIYKINDNYKPKRKCVNCNPYCNGTRCT